MTHLLVDARHAGGKWVAVCACGVEHKHDDRSLAVACVYKHIIDSARPVCPTPTKTTYGTQVEAENAMHRFWRATGNGYRPVRAYRCPSGKHWHLTKHQSPTGGRRQAA